MLRSSCGSRADLAPDSIFHCGAYVAVAPGRHGWIPEQQALAIRIVSVNDHIGTIHVDIGIDERRSDDLSKLLSKRVLDVFAASVLDRFQFELALLSA